MADEEGVLGVDEQDLLEAEFSLKKKKKKTKKKTAETEEAKPEVVEEGENNTEKNVESKNKLEDPVNSFDPPTYDYVQLLNRVVDCIHQNNPELADRKRFTMKPPQLMRFMMAELGTEGSIDGNKRLVIKGKFAPKYIESLLRKYIVEYVACEMCRSFNTNLTRDSVSRLYFVSCQDCGSSRSVAPIRAGFHAQTRADRRALRNAP